MTQKRTIVDFHIIQSLPSNNINRDMSGLPKSCLYGGVQRARVSSQAWKRAMRILGWAHAPDKSLTSSPTCSWRAKR